MGGEESSVSRRGRLLLIPTAVFIAFLVAFAVLRSSNIFGVDGAHRAFGVYRAKSLFFQDNNHLLYPTNVWAWIHVTRVVGLKTQAPLKFFSAVELMNCFAGAACLGMLSFLIYLTVPIWRLSIAVTVAYGMSKAFLEQATNANEPLVGVFWSFVAILFAMFSFRIKSTWPIFVSGFLFAMAMASYESAVFLAPVAIVLVWESRFEKQGNDLINWRQCTGILSLGLGGLLGILCIFGWAYHAEGTVSGTTLVKRFLDVGGSNVYGGVSAGKLFNIPVGMVRNVFPILADYSGIRNLVVAPTSVLAVFVLFFALLGGFFALCFSALWARRTSLSGPLRIGLVSSAIGLLSTSIPLIWWNPHYGKLWLQPLGCLAYLVAIALYLSRGESRFRRVITSAFATAVLVGVSANLAWAVREHKEGTWGMSEAQVVAESVEKQDLVVGGWDAVSLLYADIFAGDEQFMDFPSEAVLYGRGAMARLRSAMLRTRERGGKVYFVGVFDSSAKDWESFLGSRCGVPFSDMDPYRKHSVLVSKWSNGSVRVTMWQFDLDSLN
jgi:hypothetical protein